MVIGVLQLELSIPGADSLKSKRMVLRSVKDRVRQGFNVAVAEVDDNDLWQHAVLGVVTISNDRRFANEVLSKVVDYVQRERDLVLDDYSLSFL
ncbi:MAG: DUF503 domain-containing protein [Verrucomicrobiae bacterium]|nr:DUF503 domain-containing protein [Verrucomicrobiae bacterium]MDW8345109.1 DUF503 domain-containing protein [Verrucomicrobiae bacterium]